MVIFYFVIEFYFNDENLGMSVVDFNNIFMKMIVDGVVLFMCVIMVGES